MDKHYCAMEYRVRGRKRALDVSVIGISPEAAEIYRYFLRNPEQRASTARLALDMSPDAAEAAMETLGEMSLLDLTDRRRVVATDPKIGFERLIEARLDELNLEIRRVLAARDAIPSFAAHQQDGEESPPALDIERVVGPDHVRHRIDDLAFFAYRETLCLYPDGALSADAIEIVRLLDDRTLRRGLTVKSVYRPEALEDPLTGAYLRDLARHGGQVRVTEDPMDRMVVFDRDVAVVAMNPEECAEGALFIRETGLVSQLVSYFDRVWQSAADMRDLADPQTGTTQLSSMDKRVLNALATSDKDEIAARDIQVSVRTYRRYVADLMARLGVVTRFQAAVRAKERGWI
jgi:DNA-binding CsgD family transcriptional regulator/sugar-specific transcriptional regulator TrmB